MSEEIIREILIRRGQDILSKPVKPVRFSGHKDADALLNDLEGHPHAFVIACVMDRQIRAEKAWSIPHAIRERLGSFEFSALRVLPLEAVRLLMSEPEPLHRFPDVMAKNFFLAIQRIASQYSGKASKIWAGSPSSATIVRRFLEFEGIGPKIATMAANILVRDFKIPVSDKVSIDISADIQVRRVFGRLGLVAADVSNDELIYKARELNPMYPGIFDLSAWEISRRWCRPKNPHCEACDMSGCCPTAKRRGRIEEAGLHGEEA